MRYDDFAEKNIRNCSECSRNRLTYPQKEEVCLHYGNTCTETSVNGFPNHCLLEEMNEIEKEKHIKVSTIDELFDEGIDLYELVRSVEQLEKNIRSLKLEVDAISADNEYLEKKMNYHISENPPITKDMRLSVSTESETNDLVEFIREEIKECDKISPFKDVDKVRMLKKSILEQLLLDYSAKECKHVDEL